MTLMRNSINGCEIDTQHADQFNYRDGHPFPYESLWSAAHKFILLNHTTAGFFLRSFGNPEVKWASLPIWLSTKRCSIADDLRFPGRINVGKLARALNANQSWADTATVDRYTSGFHIRQASAPFLRFCPVCIEGGFHATIYQFLDVKKCPAHACSLDDCCPRCGDWIAMGFPKARGAPFSCASCGYSLWLDCDTQNWPAMYATLEQQAEIATRCSARLLKQANEIGEGVRAASLWLKSSNSMRPDKQRAGRIIQTIFDADTSGVHAYASISRAWHDSFLSRIWRHRQFGAMYSCVPFDDKEMLEALYRLYRQFERRLFRSFPIGTRKFWHKKVLLSYGFDRLPGLGMPPELLGYYMWRSYWEERPNVPCMRRIFGQDFQGSHYQRKMARSIFKLYNEHAKMLRPLDKFTSADAWAQKHYFGIVAMASYRKAVELAYTAPNLNNLMDNHLGTHISRATPPLVLLVRAPGVINSFELRIYAPKMTQGIQKTYAGGSVIYL